MNGAHDMGGMMGFGPVLPEPNEPTFHAQWERRAMALTLAMAAAGGWDLDKVRAARERLPPAEYLAKSYYQIWISALESMMIERGLVGADEIAAGKSLRPGKPVKRVLAADSVAPSLARGAPVNRDVAAPPRFAVGQRVRARNSIQPVTLDFRATRGATSGHNAYSRRSRASGFEQYGSGGKSRVALHCALQCVRAVG